jgi:hypothetical protein
MVGRLRLGERMAATLGRAGCDALLPRFVNETLEGKGGQGAGDM